MTFYINIIEQQFEMNCLSESKDTTDSLTKLCNYPSLDWLKSRTLILHNQANGKKFILSMNADEFYIQNLASAPLCSIVINDKNHAYLKIPNLSHEIIFRME